MSKAAIIQHRSPAKLNVLGAKRFATGFLFLLTAAIFATVTNGQTLEVLHSFHNFDGAKPRAELVQGTDGNFYGSTIAGADYDYGTMFRVTPNGAMTTLVTFNGTNGRAPWSGLLQVSNGNFYGSTFYGGFNANGNVFQMTSNGSLTMLASFTYGSSGSSPRGRLGRGRDGNFYGTTESGGANGYGTVFRMTTNGTLTTLVAFNNANGNRPYGELVLGSNGVFYGTTVQGGGAYNSGTVFQMTTNGLLTTLVSFNGNNGAYPQGTLVQARDGNFYGTTAAGGTNNRGTVFKMTTNGVLTTLASFNNCNGSTPVAGLIQASDGNFYGTAVSGGESSCPSGFQGYGTVFRVTPGGVLSTVISFNSSNGVNPETRLVQGRDGNFYGTTFAGGSYNLGTVFRIVMPVSLSARQTGNQIIVSWSTNFATGFILQATVDLTAPATWIDSTNLPAGVGDQVTVTNSLSGNAQFFRLRKP